MSVIENTLAKLQKILKPFVDAESGETGDYPELDEVLRAVVSWKVLLASELNDLKNVRFKDGKLYCSNLTEKERWGCRWCINLIKEFAGE